MNDIELLKEKLHDITLLLQVIAKRAEDVAEDERQLIGKREAFDQEKGEFEIKLRDFKERVITQDREHEMKIGELQALIEDQKRYKEERKKLEDIEEHAITAKNEAVEALQALNEKRFNIEQLEQRELAVAGLEEVIEREKRVDAERKKLLDARDARIKNRERQLQILATE